MAAKGQSLTLYEALIWSLKLDYEFVFHVPGIPISRKFELIVKKYWNALGDILFGFKGVKRVSVLGRNYYYDEVYGLASLQRVYCASYGLKRLLPDHPVVVDVGANIGQFAFFCSHYLQAERVVSIEPIKECHKLPQMNSLSPSDCLNVLVSSDQGEQRFYICEGATQLSSTIRDEREFYSEGIMLVGHRLSDLIRESTLEWIDLLKVDTEGSEYDVLLSGDEVLDMVGGILVEISLFRNATGGAFDTGYFLERRHFKLASMVCARGATPKDADALFLRR